MKKYTDLNSFPNWAKVEKDEFAIGLKNVTINDGNRYGTCRSLSS